MSTVRSILGPLFPGVTFADEDRAFVERLSVPVGEHRAEVEQVFPGQAFADTDVLVVETARRAMTDTVVLPGELTSDTFDGPAGPVSGTIWNPAPRVTLDGSGHAVFPLDDQAQNPALRLISTAPVAGKVVTAQWAQLAVPANGYNIAELKVARASNPANYYVRMRESGGQMLWSAYAYGGTQSSTPYKATDHKQWRLRVADQVYVEASGDGQAWTQLGTIALPTWVTEPCVYTVSAGPWDPRGNSATPNLLEGFSLV